MLDKTRYQNQPVNLPSPSEEDSVDSVNIGGQKFDVNPEAGVNNPSITTKDTLEILTEAAEEFKKSEVQDESRDE